MWSWTSRCALEFPNGDWRNIDDQKLRFSRTPQDYKGNGSGSLGSGESPNSPCFAFYWPSPLLRFYSTRERTLLSWKNHARNPWVGHAELDLVDISPSNPVAAASWPRLLTMYIMDRPRNESLCLWPQKVLHLLSNHYALEELSALNWSSAYNFGLNINLSQTE